MNSYDSSAISRTFGKYSGANDGTLRVTFPGDDTLGVITYDEVTPTYGVHSSFADFGKKGHAVKFLEKVLKDNGISKYEVVEFSQDAYDASPDSSFTRCLHMIGLNSTDVCVGHTW